jgi:hypothetical protein
MLEYLVDFLLGASIKMADEIADVPYLSNKFASYITPIIMISIFLYGLRAVDDFYYNLIWLSWFFSAYFGKSIENELDKQNWNLIFGMVLFASSYTISFPLPQTNFSVLFLFIFITSLFNIIENIALPEEISISKIVITFIYIILILVGYFYILSPIIINNPTSDLRFVSKQTIMTMGYLIVRIVSKVFLYIYAK